MIRIDRALGALRTTLFTAALTLASVTAAHALDLPAPSPLARAMQTVGVSEVTIEYSSPGVKGRKIFGGLVPFGELWRTGANSATKLTLTNPAKIGGKDVPAGTYAVFTIPTASKWTVILNKNPNQGGTRSYDQKLDQVRFEVTPTQAPKRERMTFLFSNTTDTATELQLWWDTALVTIPVQFDTKKLSLANIKTAVSGASRELASGARYHADTLKDLKTALTLIDASLAVERTWFNVWLKADFLARKGDYKAAYPLAQEAWKMGNKAEYFFWKDQVKKALDEWKKKLK